MADEKRRIIDPKMTVIGYIIQKRINMESEYKKFMTSLSTEDKQYYEKIKTKDLGMRIRCRLLAISIVYIFVFIISSVVMVFGKDLSKETKDWLFFSTSNPTLLTLFIIVFLVAFCFYVFFKRNFKKFVKEEIEGKRFQSLVNKSEFFYKKAKEQAKETAVRNSSIPLE